MCSVYVLGTPLSSTDFIGICSEHSRWYLSIILKYYHQVGASLEPREVEDCITEDFGPLAPSSSNIVEFVDYILETYVCSEASFLPEI